jgi:hypothetical protein
MKETIYLVVTKHKTERMTKNLPSLSRGELPLKILLTVDEKAFQEPVITKEVVINDWREGIDLSDVEFRGSFITPEEAEMIKQKRLQKMSEILGEQGYQVIAPETDELKA